MGKVFIGVTGPPGVGKTTLVIKVVEAARLGLRTCGFVTAEVRSGGRRTGFDVVDVSTGARTPLARVGTGEPSVGKYVVLLEACNAIEKALLSPACDLLVVDEVGAMEFKCPNFASQVEAALSRFDKALATFHRNYTHYAKRWGFELLTLSKENRDSVFKTVLQRLGIK
ncbi:MAG: NTPase [Pyrobaculum sp.]